MTLRLLHGGWWTIVCPPYVSFVTTRKDVSPEQYVACCLH